MAAIYGPFIFFRLLECVQGKWEQEGGRGEQICDCELLSEGIQYVPLLIISPGPRSCGSVSVGDEYSQSPWL